MEKIVYLIGHGRVDKSKVCELQANTTVHWLAPVGDVTGGLSDAFLRGSLDREYGYTGGGARPLEHYLCADVGMMNDKKIDAFFQRTAAHPHGSGDPYILFTRDKVNVSLTSISKFLHQLSPSADWHMYWTCCRGYIGVKNEYKSTWKSGAVVRETRINPPATPGLSAQEHQTRDCGFDTVVLVAKSDQGAVTPDKRSNYTVGSPNYSNKIYQILRNQ